MYTINIGEYTVGDKTYDNRCLSASIGGFGIHSDVIPWDDKKHNPWDYKYDVKKDKFILDVIGKEEK